MKKLWIAMAMCLVAAAAGAEEAQERAKDGAKDGAKKEAAAAEAKKEVAKPASESAAKAVKAEEPAAKPAAAAAAPAEGELKVEAKICKRIENREPAEEGSTFAVTDGAVHAWTRVHGATGSKVHHVWFKGDTQISDVELNVGGSPWRTYSRKTLGEESKGDWRVEIRDASGSVLETLKFSVQ